MRRRGSCGASAPEYIVVFIIVAIAGIFGYRQLSGQFKCLLAQATGLFGGADAAACSAGGESGGGSLAANEPGTGGEHAGPSPSSTCVGGVCKPGSGKCFVAGTLVWTPGGPRAIERLQVGDEVLARDPESGETIARRVAQTFATPDMPLVSVLVGDEDGRSDELVATPGHPFWTADLGWRRADALSVGEPLGSADGTPLTVRAVQSLGLRDYVYNVEVEEAHSYFAGALGVWVHNPPGKQNKKKKRAASDDEGSDSEDEAKHKSKKPKKGGKDEDEGPRPWKKASDFDASALETEKVAKALHDKAGFMSMTTVGVFKVRMPKKNPSDANRYEYFVTTNVDGNQKALTNAIDEWNKAPKTRDQVLGNGKGAPVQLEWVSTKNQKDLGDNGTWHAERRFLPGKWEELRQHDAHLEESGADKDACGAVTTGGCTDALLTANKGTSDETPPNFTQRPHHAQTYPASQPAFLLRPRDGKKLDPALMPPSQKGNKTVGYGPVDPKHARGVELNSNLSFKEQTEYHIAAINMLGERRFSGPNDESTAQQHLQDLKDSVTKKDGTRMKKTGAPAVWTFIDSVDGKLTKGSLAPPPTPPSSPTTPSSPSPPASPTPSGSRPYFQLGNSSPIPEDSSDDEYTPSSQESESFHSVLGDHLQERIDESGNESGCE